jgi:hypothetical protein
MDLSFARRKKGATRPGTPDLHALLSAAAARQALSATARAHWQGQSSRGGVDPVVALFAADVAHGHGTHPASFATMSHSGLNGRQSS